MGNNRDSLGDRMKRYENVPKVSLVRRMPVIIRLDGKAFHTFTRGFVKPFDTLLMQTMNGYYEISLRKHSGLCDGLYSV